MNTKYKRIEPAKMKQLMIIPSFGITWGGFACKFSIAFAWLNFGVIIRCFMYD